MVCYARCSASGAFTPAFPPEAVDVQSRWSFATSMLLPSPSLIVLMLATASIALAAPASRVSEYELLRTLPEGLYPSLMMGEPDERGFVGYHRQTGQWYQAGYQRAGARHLLGGVIAGDRARMEAGWRSVETAFAHQIEDGGFLSRPRPGAKAHDLPARVETAYFYLQALNHALLVLRDSPFEPEFRARVEALKPKVARATDFVLAGYDGIVAKVGHTANRLFIAAKALGLSGVLLEREDYRAAARRLVATALTLRDAEGVFIESGGRDSSYNAVSILMAQELALYLPDPSIDAAMKQAMVWQLTRILPNGEVLVGGNTRTGLGQEKNRGGTGIKTVNTREVALALIYHGLKYDRPDVIAVGRQIAARRSGGED